jgi:hypothetical protein
VSGQLAGADWVDITDADDVVHRYREDRVPGGLDETLVAMGDRYAAVEWNQFLRQRPPQVASRTTGKAEHAVARTGAGDSSGDGGGARTRSEAMVGPMPEQPAPDAPRASPPPAAPAAPEPAPSPGADERAVSVAALSPEPPCRRACGLRGRVCIAACREQPVSGGHYDACARACEDDAVACRGRCKAR